MSTSPRIIDLEAVKNLVGQVPAYTEFPTVDQLTDRAEAVAASAPGVARRRRIGSSRLGEPIHALTIGDAARHAVVFGGVHPNEPIGGLTALHLAETLVGDKELLAALGYTWHIVTCIDPDGMRLNEGWFGATMNRAEYGRHFYRPAPDEQVEWTFPLEYKELYFDRVIPETLALMRLIDDVRPTFMCSLHNGELGGVYYYLSREAPELYPALHAIPAHLGIPLDTGEPEAPYVPRLAAAIFGDTSVEEAYEYRRKLGLDPGGDMASGTSSGAYASRHNTFTLVSELPYWTHPDAGDGRPSDTNYAAVLRDRAAGMTELGDLLIDVLSQAGPDLQLNTPYLRASRQFAPHFTQLAEQESRRAELPESDRRATVAESFTGADLVHCFRLRYGGMVLRALEAEITAGNGTPLIRAQHARLEATYNRWGEEAIKVTPPTTIPIGSLVGVQYGAILAAACYAADRFGPTSIPAEADWSG